MRDIILILSAVLLLCLAGGCNGQAGSTTQPAVVVNVPPISIPAGAVTIEPGAVVLNVQPGAIIVNVTVGSDKVPLVNVVINGKLFGTTRPATRPAKEQP
jgi:hypothetical protein